MPFLSDFIFLLIAFYILAIRPLPPFPNEGIPIKETESENQVVQMLNESDERTQENSGGLGTQEIKRGDGGSDKIYYSVTTPEEEAKSQQEEKEKLDKSWEMLRDVIIDNRNK